MSNQDQSGKKCFRSKMTLKKIKDWIKNHKIAFGAILLGIIVVGLIFYGIFGTFWKAKRISTYQISRESLLLESPSPLGVSKGIKFWKEEVGGGEGGEIEIKEGSVQIESKDAEADSAKIRTLVEETYQGYIERSSKSSTNLYTLINLTLKIPSDKLLDLLDELKRNFKVKSYHIRNYRISIERELDELEILRRTLSDYEEIREEIKKMPAGKDKIELLMKLTDKELEIKRKERNYQREVSYEKRRGMYATLEVSLKQKKSPKIWPENVLAQFKDRIRKALEKVVEILKDLIGGSIELFFKVIQIAIYLFIIALVAGFFFKIGKKIFWRLFK